MASEARRRVDKWANGRQPPKNPEGVLPGHRPGCDCSACAEVIAKAREEVLLRIRKMHNDRMDSEGYTELEKQIFWACMDAGLRPPHKDSKIPSGLPPEFVKQHKDYMDNNGYTEEEKRICLMCFEAGIRPPNITSRAVGRRDVSRGGSGRLQKWV